MSGRRSTRSWLYENRPSTQSAAITIVAKTGLLIEMRVNHMAAALARERAYERGTGAADADADGADDAAAASSAPRCATTFAGAPSLRLSKRIARICAPGARPFTTSMRPDARS